MRYQDIFYCIFPQFFSEVDKNANQTEKSTNKIVLQIKMTVNGLWISPVSCVLLLPSGPPPWKGNYWELQDPSSTLHKGHSVSDQPMVCESLLRFRWNLAHLQIMPKKNSVKIFRDVGRAVSEIWPSKKWKKGRFLRRDPSIKCK